MHDVVSIKHDRTLGLAPIFKPLQRGERSESKLDVSINGEKEQVRVTCFEPLGADDQTILFSVLSLCTSESRSQILSHEPMTEVGRSLRSELFIRRSSQRDSLMVSVSEWELLSLCGKTDGRENYEHLRDTLARLASVNIRVKNDHEDYVVRLLAYHVNKDNGQVQIAVNTRSAAAILGDQYAYIDLADHRRLGYEAAKILHGWLSTWMPQGSTRRIGAGKLASHIYPNYDSVAPDSRRTYRSYTKRAAMMLKDLGWSVELSGRGEKAMYEISRPKNRDPVPY